MRRTDCRGDCAEIRVRVGVPENHLMRRMVALIAEFESHIALQLALEYEIPFVHQRIAKIRLHTAHRNARIQCERTQWISTRKAARHEIAVEALRLVDTYIGAVALIARKVHRFIERHTLAAVGAAALVFFTTVEDAVSNAENGLVHYPIGDADARSEICLIPGNQIVGYLAARYGDSREQGREVRRQSSVRIPTGGHIERIGLDVVV